MDFDKEVYDKLFKEFYRDKRIIDSNATFKIKFFLKKSENSLQIANFHKNIKPTMDQPDKLYWHYWAIIISYYSMLYAAKAAILSKGYEVKDHDSAQIALGHLLVPNEIEKEDLELLEEAHKIFEDEYVKYFEEAKQESYIARYSATKQYTARKVEEIFEKARKFIEKIELLI